MALFHFTVTQIKRSAGQSVVACAAYDNIGIVPMELLNAVIMGKAA